MAVTKDMLVSELQQLLRRTPLEQVGRTGAFALRATPVQAAVTVARRAVGAPFGVAVFGVNQLSGLVQRFGREAVEDVPAETPARAGEPYPPEGTVDVAVDAFGAVGSLTDNTGVEPDGKKAPFPGYDTLSGDLVMAHVAESTDLPDLQVLLAYEEAHKNRKGVVQAVEVRLAALGAPVS